MRSWPVLSPGQRRWLALPLSLFIAIGTVLLPVAQTGRAAPSRTPAVPLHFASGIVLVHRKPGVGAASLASFAIDHTTPVPSGFAGVDLLHVPPGQEEAVAERLRLSGRVDFAEPDYRRSITLTPNDPLYPDQWALPKIKAPLAWQTTLGSTKVTIAVIDTGYDLNHPDRPVNLIAGPTFVSQPDPSCGPEGINGPDDDDGHGTHVGGIIAAAFNNGVGVAGLAPGVNLLVIKAGDCIGSFLDSDIAAAIQYATNHGARVINMSFGGIDVSNTLQQAVQYAASRGVILVAAAGNDGKNEQFYPASYPQVVAVAASDATDQVAAFSNYGPQIAVAAPGVSILSTIAPVGQFAGLSQPYYYLSGTSMAAPHVAAIAGLILSAYPNLTSSQVIQAIEQGAIPLGTSCPDPHYGYGRVDAYNALTAAQNLAAAQPTTTTYYLFQIFLPLVANNACRLTS